MIVVGIAGYFSGSYFANPDENLVTKEELANALSELESKMITTQQLPSQPSQPVKISIDDDPIRGDPNAPITIVEFSDFQCPFCKQAKEDLKEFSEKHPEIRIVYKNLPLIQIHDQ